MNDINLSNNKTIKNDDKKSLLKKDSRKHADNEINTKSDNY